MKDRNRMKILIAYDGSEGAESAIDDLKRAGLPRRAEAVALTIVEELIPMSALRPGSKLIVKVLRGGKVIELSAEVEKKQVLPPDQ